MSRESRKRSSTGIYHVMIRGINRQDIFEEPEDYWMMIRILSGMEEKLAEDLKTRIHCSNIYAYCLMPNHVHLLVQEQEWDIGTIVKSIAASYVMFYNRKYGRVGHLFQERFKSEPCNDDEYFLTLLRYIHQNPVKVGLTKTAKDYQYSSWGNDYFGLAPDRVCQIETVLKRFPMTELTELVDTPLKEVCCLDIDTREVIPDDNIRLRILHIADVKTMIEFSKEMLPTRLRIIEDVMKTTGAKPRQMSRITGVNFSTIAKLRRRP